MTRIVHLESILIVGNAERMKEKKRQQGRLLRATRTGPRHLMAILSGGGACLLLIPIHPSFLPLCGFTVDKTPPLFVVSVSLAPSSSEEPLFGRTCV